MLTRRIIPCLDVKDGRTVKGVQFQQLRDAGDPVALGARYAAQGADELVYLDITATQEGRNAFADLVARVAQAIDIPFTVGGGVAAVADVERLLQAGADKVSVNSAAVRRPALIEELAVAFGSQCVVVAMDVKTIAGEWVVHVQGGNSPTPRRLIEWASECAARGAGELLLTSMDHDGSKLGFANEMLATLNQSVRLPIIASGGAGTMQHFADAFTQGQADAALAASVFHYNEIAIPELKAFLASQHIPVRPV